MSLWSRLLPSRWRRSRDCSAIRDAEANLAYHEKASAYLYLAGAAGAGDFEAAVDSPLANETAKFKTG
jgi:hypothetical protein